MIYDDSSHAFRENSTRLDPTGRPATRCPIRGTARVGAGAGAGACAIGEECGRGSAGGTEPRRSVGDAGGVSGRSRVEVGQIVPSGSD